MGWNANLKWSSSNGVGLRGVSPGHILLDLIAAWNERCDLAFHPTGDSYKVPDNYWQWTGPGDFPYSAISQMEQHIETMIPKFVNCDDAGGDWTGGTSIPSWNLTALETAIGFSRPNIRSGSTYAPIKYATPGGFFPLLWCKWKYEAMNRLKWTWKYDYRAGFSPPVQIQLVKNYEKIVTSNVSYADIATQWPAAAWAERTFLPRWTEKFAYYNGSNYWTATIYAPEYTMPINTNDLKFDLDVYVKTRKAYYFNWGDWASNGYNVVEDKFGKVYEFTNQQAAANSITLDTRPHAELTVPADPTAATNGVRGFQQLVTEAVVKYDVPGGLEYVA